MAESGVIYGQTDIDSRRGSHKFDPTCFLGCTMDGMDAFGNTDRPNYLYRRSSMGESSERQSSTGGDGSVFSVFCRPGGRRSSAEDPCPEWAGFPGTLQDGPKAVLSVLCYDSAFTLSPVGFVLQSSDDLEPCFSCLPFASQQL